MPVRGLNGDWGSAVADENTGANDGVTEETDEQGQDQPKEFEAITSQEDFDKAIQARIARERNKFADYGELKAKAEKLTKIEEANKTEAQKQQEALAEAQAKLAELTTAKTRAEVAAAKGVPAELLSGSTQEELEASADALIKFKGETPKGPILPNQGKAPESAPKNANDWLREMANQ